MKRTMMTMFILLLVAAVSMIQAQNLEQVLDKHFKAIGQEKLLEQKSYSIKANVQQMGMEIPMVMKIKRPDKFRMEIDMQGQKMIQAYNGEKGWAIAPWMSPDPQELTGEQLQQAMDQADIDGELYNYKSKGHKAELVGKEDLDGKEVYNIKLTTNKGIVKNYYINADTYLIEKVKSTVNAQGQEVAVEQKMSDYEKTDGVMIARKIISESPMGTATITIEDVSFNDEIDDQIFERPAE